MYMNIHEYEFHLTPYRRAYLQIRVLDKLDLSWHCTCEHVYDYLLEVFLL